MRTMEGADDAVEDKPNARAAPLDDGSAQGNEQRLDSPPLQRSRNRHGKQGLQGLAVLGVHEK